MRPITYSIPQLVVQQPVCYNGKMHTPDNPSFHNSERGNIRLIAAIGLACIAAMVGGAIWGLSKGTRDAYISPDPLTIPPTQPLFYDPNYEPLDPLPPTEVPTSTPTVVVPVLPQSGFGTK